MIEPIQWIDVLIAIIIPSIKSIKYATWCFGKPLTVAIPAVSATSILLKKRISSPKSYGNVKYITAQKTKSAHSVVMVYFFFTTLDNVCEIIIHIPYLTNNVEILINSICIHLPNASLFYNNLTGNSNLMQFAPCFYLFAPTLVTSPQS